MAGFFSEYRRRRAIWLAITCIECRSTDTELIGPWYRRHRHCRSCDAEWEQGSGDWMGGMVDGGGG